MKKHLILIPITIMFICVGFSGCLSSEESKFIGSWKDNMGQVYHFKDEILSKCVEITVGGLTVNGDWHIDDNILYITANLDSQTSIDYKYTYTINEDTIILNPYGGTGFKLTLTKI